MSTNPLYLPPDRIFRLWSFHANHNQLLLRSESYVGNESDRVEIYFGNTDFMVLSPILRGIHLREANDPELARLEPVYRSEISEWSNIFLLNEAGTQFVASSRPTWRAGRRDFDAPSLFDFNLPWPQQVGDSEGDV